MSVESKVSKIGVHEESSASYRRGGVKFVADKVLGVSPIAADG